MIDLHDIREGAAAFVESRRTPGRPFGHFNLCHHALVDDELSALTVALELWKMLGLPLDGADLDYTCRRIEAMQNPVTGLLIDPSWHGRLEPEGVSMLETGDSFFTRSAICALEVWGMHLPRPVAYLLEESPQSLLERIRWNRGGHHPFSLGDIAVLINHNAQLAVPGADELQSAFQCSLQARQDPATGLWLESETDAKGALTPHINLTFHTIKFTFNVFDAPLPHADRMIDSCLAACDDARYYSWETGYACNDLDLAHVLYSATRWSGHRRSEVAEWARRQLPGILRNRLPDGGFPFHHGNAMRQHYQLKVSPGEPESDLWGTLMYLGALAMMVKLAQPGADVPWGFSRVHAVPQRPAEFGNI